MSSPLESPRPWKAALIALGLLLACLPSIKGAEYFVASSGSDTHPGTSPDAPFQTIQRGVDALAPGDVLTIGPGEYFGNVSRKGLGAAGSRTLIRAEIPGTVLLRGDQRAPKFRPAEGLPRVYVADFDGDVQCVNEVDTLTLLEPVPTVEDLVHRPGSYFHDPKAKKLYLSTSDLQPVANHAYTLSTIAQNGFFLEEPTEVTLDGIAATGFNTCREVPNVPGNFTVWGILLFNPVDCVVRNATAYLNGGGIAIRNGIESSRNNVVEYCTAYGNYSPFSGSGGNILMFAPKDGVIRHSLSYRSKGFGLRLYGQGMLGANAIEDSLAWGTRADLFIKGGGSLGTATRSVAVGAGNVAMVKNVMVGEDNIYLQDADYPKDSIRLQNQKLDRNEEFADPENFDFRLQATSRFRSAGPDGSDQGASPYHENVVYVKPNGNDAADGLSLRSAWRSLQRATRNLRPGDTLYLESGTYKGGAPLHLSGTQEKPIIIRGRGAGEVILADPILLKESLHVRFERVSFEKPVTVKGGSDLRFLNCRFSGTPEGLALSDTTNVRVEHCAFKGGSETGILATAVKQLSLSSNFFDNQKGAAIKAITADAILYSDYNVYTRLDAVLSKDGKLTSLSAERPLLDTHSSQISTSDSPTALFGRGALGKPAGPYREAQKDAVFMSKPVVHSVSATTANLEWVVSDKLICKLAWGETPACENTLDFQADQYGAFSLTRLKPGTTYYFQIRSLSYPFSQSRKPGPARCDQPEFDTISFTTAAQSATPLNYFVAPDGDNANDGLSRAKAWQSVAYAAGQVNAGDTVWVAGGTYPERVRIRATGEKDAPITFRSLPGERVEFSSGGKLLENSWVISGKSNIVVDGFYFSQFRNVGGNTTAPRVFSIYGSSAVKISRCFGDARGRGYGPGFLTVVGGHDVSVSNCVMISGFNSIGVNGCPGFRLEQCVIVVPMIQATMITTGESKEPHLLRNNIFTDSSAYKVKVWLQEWKGQNSIVDQNNAYFPRVPDAERQLYWILSFQEKGKDLGHTRMGLEEYRQRVLPATDSLIADPQFAGLAGKTSKSGYPPDAVLSPGGKMDFADFFTTNPELIRRGIGLQPEKFKEFHFNSGAATARKQ